jgi:hypothetical protein
MGTSGSYGGPSGKPPLLPPELMEPAGLAPVAPDTPPQSPPPELPLEAQPKEESQENTPEHEIAPETEPSEYNQTSTWTSAKGSMTRYAHSGNDEGLKRTGRRYIGTRGGSRNFARAAVSGKKTAAALGHFLTDVATHGINAALEKRGLEDSLGKSVEVIIAEIADNLAPPGTTNEESVARQAIIDAIASLYEEYDLQDGNLAKLDSIGKEDVEKVFETYVVSYIYERWLQELGKRIEDNAISESWAIKLEKEVKEYVRGAVKIDFDDYDLLTLDWNAAGQTIENIFGQAYSFLEVEE